MLMSPVCGVIRSTGVKLLVIIIITAEDLRMELFLTQVLNSGNQSHGWLYLSLNCDSLRHAVHQCVVCEQRQQ